MLRTTFGYPTPHTAQEGVFFKQVPEGGKLRLFGSTHTNEVAEKSKAAREHLQATLPRERLLSAPPTNYRRWWNNSWFVGRPAPGGRLDRGR